MDKVLTKKQETEIKHVKKIPNPDSDIVSQIHVVVIAPQTNKNDVTITCLTLQIHTNHNRGNKLCKTMRPKKLSSINYQLVEPIKKAKEKAKLCTFHCVENNCQATLERNDFA